MKRRFVFILLVLSLFLFVFAAYGCRKNTLSSNPFDVFSNNFSAKISVEINGNASVCLYEKTETGSNISFVSPDVIRGYIFTVNGEETILKSGNVSIIAGQKISTLPRLLDEVFSEQKDRITEIKTEKNDNGVITVINTFDSVYHFNENGIPIYAEGIKDKTSFKIKFDTFISEKDASSFEDGTSSYTESGV